MKSYLKPYLSKPVLYIASGLFALSTMTSCDPEKWAPKGDTYIEKNYECCDPCDDDKKDKKIVVPVPKKRSVPKKTTPKVSDLEKKVESEQNNFPTNFTYDEKSDEYHSTKKYDCKQTDN